MNRNPDVELVLRDYLADDGLTAPDYILDVVEGRIRRQPQRRSWRLPWRNPMSTPFKLAAGLAAVVLVALVGWQLLPGRQNGIGSQPSPTPTGQPSVSPSVAPTSVGVVDLPEGLLPGGRYRIQLSFIDPGLSIVAEVPAGWSGHPEFSAVTSPEGNNVEVIFSFMEVDGLFSDPCHWDLDGTGAIDQPGDVEVGPAVGDLVTALKANTSYTSSTPNPVTFGQFEGQELELQLPGDDVLSTCDQQGPESPFDGPAYFVFSGKDAGWYAQGPDNHWQLFIVDVEGTRLVTLLSYFDETSQADVEAARAIVESFEITP
jgi:hypothetical protein